MTDGTTETVDSENTDVEADQPEVEQEQSEDPAAGLKSALQKERTARKELEKRERELKRQLEDRDKTPDERVLDEAKREAAAEATRAAYSKLVQVEFRAAAKDRGLDPRTAVKLADLDGIEVGEDGEVDASALLSALDAVVEEHPSLVPSRFNGTADQGARGKKPEEPKVNPNDLIRAAFKRS